jgi:acetyl esterase/lipase
MHLLAGSSRFGLLFFSVFLIACTQHTCGATDVVADAGHSIANVAHKPYLPATIHFEIVDDMRVLRNFNYTVSSLQPAQSLDLYLPLENSSAPQHPFPVVVYIHGGGWLHGDKANPECTGACAALVKNGFAAASINYRLINVAIWPAQIHDCKAAIRCLRAHAKQFNLDTEHIGVWGASAGGHLAAELGVTNSNAKLEGNEGYNNELSTVAAVCDWYGPTDLTTLKSQLKQFHMSRDVSNMASWLVGGSLDSSNERAVEASPVTYASNNSPPFLIMHSDNDPIVPPAQSQELVDALNAKGAQARLVILHGYGHDFLGRDAQKQVLDFFDLHLKHHQ